MDPELTDFYNQAYATKEDIRLDQLAQRRAISRRLLKDVLASADGDVQIKEHFVWPSSGSENIRLITISKTEATGLGGALLHMHGGAFILGCPEADCLWGIELVRATSCTFVAVDYRLAPDAPYPASIEDCYAALCWLHINASDLNVDRTKIAVGGNSAGGGLAASLAILARDRGGCGIAHQFLVYPMLDDRTGTTVDLRPGVDNTLLADCVLGWQSLLGGLAGAPTTSPYAAAARAANLTNLPPTFIATGALDIFIDEGMDFASRLLAAGNSLELHVFPGAYHGFDLCTDAKVTQNFRRIYIDAAAKVFDDSIQFVSNS